ncbi:glycosyltransferase family 9 protein [Fluviispira multicolorata]|nr:glycosyltransferase family 9 protein [Fluviispira multicolorata]
MNNFERIVFITRMSAIGDVIIASRIIAKLKLNGYFPVLVTSFITEEIAQRIKDLNAYICIDKDLDIRYSFNSQVLIKEHFIQKINNIKTNKNNIYIDLQKTKRSRRAKKIIEKQLHLSFNASYSVNKRILYRIFLIFLSYFCVSQKRNSVIKKITRIHDLQEQLIDKIIKNDKSNISQFITIKPTTLIYNKSFPLPKINYICIFPGASNFIKMWPKESFKELIHFILSRTNADIILCGAKSEEFIGEYLNYPNNKRVLNLIDKTTLGQTLDLIANANYIVSNDSFASHAADAYNKPASVIFGATSPNFGFAPLYEKISIEYENLSCSPCSRHGKSHCRFKNLKCLKSISSENIYSKIKNYF